MQIDVQKLMKQLHSAKTPYHTVALCARELEAQGYVRLEEGEDWSILRGGRYFLVRDGSAMVAFSVGHKAGGFRIVASHTDSPCLKIKGEKPFYENGYLKWNVERYGGALLYSFLDIPLAIAGREISYDPQTGKLLAVLVEDTHLSVIPSLAIHFNREANSALSLNAQTDMQPVYSLDAAAYPVKENILGRDLYLVNAAAPYLAGARDELLVSARLDNLVSVFASLEALSEAGDSGVSMIFLADNEEVGSHTKQGAGSDFLSSAVRRICDALGESCEKLLSQSYFVSCDGAHAVHPNHPEKSDSKNPVTLGGGVVIKHHAGQNYTTDGFSEAVFKAVLQKANIPYQDFYMRADMPCGGTLGAISSTQLSVRSIDIGISMLAMHSATETMATADYVHLVRALSAFFAAEICLPSCERGVVS